MRDDLSRLRGALQAPLRRLSGHDDDPYWDGFINRPPNDARNILTDIMKKVPEGNVFPTQDDLHSPNVTTKHVKELSTYLGAHFVGIVDLSKQSPELARGYRFAIVNGVRSEYDPYSSPGVGGQTAVQKGQFITWIEASWIREMGFRATVRELTSREEREHLAVAAGLGQLNNEGRLSVPKYGTKVHVVDIIYTDLPVQADG